MTSNVQLAASLRARLLNVARAKGADYNFLLTIYALERFLYRLSRSAYKSELVLKGAMLFQLWGVNMHRPTRDLDLLAEGVASRETVATKIQNICSMPVEDDGLQFDLSHLSVEDIREESQYGGVRARFIAFLGSAKIAIQIDFAVGDAVTPPPLDIPYPTLLNMPAPHILAYPRETVVAEKLEAIVTRGMSNSRMKDYFDLWFIFTTFEDDLGTTASAIRQTFTRRNQIIPIETPIGITAEFANNPQKLLQWRAFVSRTVGRELTLDEVVRVIRDSATPMFTSASSVGD
jgi:predicted nucleotidyltransferase component of viral defense system